MNNQNGHVEIVSDFIVRKVLLLESVVLKDGNKWRVYDGEYRFLAALNDEAFLVEVNKGGRFKKGDVLVVDLRQTQTVEGATLKNDYAIVKVHEHRATLQQALL